MTHYCDATKQNKILQQNNLQIVRVCVCVKTNEGGESSHQEGIKRNCNPSISGVFCFEKKKSRALINKSLDIPLIHIENFFVTLFNKSVLLEVLFCIRHQVYDQ